MIRGLSLVSTITEMLLQHLVASSCCQMAMSWLKYMVASVHVVYAGMNMVSLCYETRMNMLNMLIGKIVWLQSHYYKLATLES